eukprot:5969800-Pyramimonas_sp.AAC.1
MRPTASATAAATVAPNHLAAARARLGWRGRRDAPAIAKHISQSPPHGTCKASCGCAGVMSARQWGVSTRLLQSNAPHRFACLKGELTLRPPEDYLSSFSCGNLH